VVEGTRIRRVPLGLAALAVAAVTVVCAHPSAASADVNCADGLYSSEWMTCMDKHGPPAWKEMPVNRMALPGSHDAQTDGLEEKLLYSGSGSLNDGEHGSACGAYDPAFNFDRDAVVASSRTQTLSLKKQLNAGVRYLDVRFGWPTWRIDYNVAGRRLDQYHGAHGSSTGQTMKEQLDDVVSWARDHPREQVIVDLTLCGIRGGEKQERAISLARNNLGITDHTGLCSVSGDYGNKPGLTLRKDVQPGHNVTVLYKDWWIPGLKADFGHACGWRAKTDARIKTVWPGVTGSERCKPDFLDTYPQWLIKRRSNDAIEAMRQQYKEAIFDFDYALGDRLFGPQLIWTLEPASAVARFVFHTCPETLLENNDMLRGHVYDNPSGIQTRGDLMNEFKARSNVFLVDNPDPGFLKQVIELNDVRARQGPVSYEQFGGWLVLSDRRCMDLPGGNAADSAQFQMHACNGTEAQLFQLTEGGRLRVADAPFRCLEDHNNKVLLASCKNMGNQRWRLGEQGRLLASAGRCVQPENDKIVIRDCDARRPWQLWTLVGQIRSGANLCLDGGTDVEALYLENCAEPDDPVQRSGQFFAHTTRGELKVLDSCVEAGPVLAYFKDCTGATNQKWELSGGEVRLASGEACMSTRLGKGRAVTMSPCGPQNPPLSMGVRPGG
jgi:hypothetical protein